MHLGPYSIIVIAGVISALCYVSVAFAPPPAFLLGYVAPLAILIAGLGWGLAASSGAAMIATVIILLIAGFGTGLFYLLAVGGPAVWLSHLAVLGRAAPVAPGATDDTAMEWYPLGRLLIWAGVLGGSALALTFARAHFDLDAYKAGLEALLTEIIKQSKFAAGASDDARADIVSGLAYGLPLAAALLWTATTLVNLWLAARIVQYAGQLPRPWPDLSATELPPLFLASYLAIFAFAALSGGAVGYVLAFYASALSLVWILIGLGVLHVVTRGRSFRRPLLIFIYVILIVFGWPALPLMVLGVVEQLVQLRRRFTRAVSAPSTLS